MLVNQSKQGSYQGQKSLSLPSAWHSLAHDRVNFPPFLPRLPVGEYNVCEIDSYSFLMYPLQTNTLMDLSRSCSCTKSVIFHNQNTIQIVFILVIQSLPKLNVLF